MPRGGRRPGAGAPKGNFNGLKGGAYSRRMRFALATLLSVPEYRQVVRLLHTAGEQAHRDFTELVLASTRMLYDRPFRQELRVLVDRAATDYINRVGPDSARKAIRSYQRQLGVDDILKNPAGRKIISRRKVRTADPIFREFVRLMHGRQLAPTDAPESPKMPTNRSSRRTRPPLSARRRGAGGEVQAINANSTKTPRSETSPESKVLNPPKKTRPATTQSNASHKLPFPSGKGSGVR